MNTNNLKKFPHAQLKVRKIKNKVQQIYLQVKNSPSILIITHLKVYNIA
jgi:hypothetical protein